LLLVEVSIDQGTQRVVFEPNDEPLCARMRQQVSNFPLTIWRAGMLTGATPHAALFLSCGHTTITPPDIEDGRVIYEIGIPLPPGRVRHLRIRRDPH
jgi:uncharacterized protein